MMEHSPTSQADPAAAVLTAVQEAAQGAIHLAKVSGSDRSRALRAMAQNLRERQDAILEANTLDLETSHEMAMPDLILDWLKLTPERLQTAVQVLQKLSDLSDPIQQVISTKYPVENCQSYAQHMPLGVIALVYEALPELAAIAAGLCLRTGNSLVLKGGNEASHSNQAIAAALQAALEEVSFPLACVTHLASEQGSSIRDLVTQDAWINLVIPYGRPSLVQQVVRQATAPVLRTAIGNCYLYWSASGSLEMVRRVILESHRREPDAVNAIEKVLVHTKQNPAALTSLWSHLREHGFRLKGDEALVAEFPELEPTAPEDWSQSALDRVVIFKWVDSLATAITWINHYSSGHADCLITESYRESRQFAIGVTSAAVYINASPQFTRNPKRARDIALGMSSQKGHRRGAIGLETLTTLKQVIQGNGVD
ncbi:glutamate-5-semialdehyde dehydrogenase [Trichothermofontia sp.]